MVGWLYCFTNRNDYLLHIKVKMKNFIFRTPKGPLSACLYNPCLSAPFSPPRGQHPRGPWGQPKLCYHRRHDPDLFIITLFSNPFKPLDATSCVTRLKLDLKCKDPGIEQTPNE